MTESYNYIRVKSKRELDEEVEKAQLIIYKAGALDSMPGATRAPVGRTVPTGVRMPGSFESVDMLGGDALKGSIKHSWTISAGMGQSDVGMPPLEPRPALTSENSNYPWPWDTRIRRLMTMSDPQEGQFGRPNTFDGANHSMPGDVYATGQVPWWMTDGSVGRDIHAVDRIIREKRRRTRRGER